MFHMDFSDLPGISGGEIPVVSRTFTTFTSTASKWRPLTDSWRFRGTNLGLWLVDDCRVCRDNNNNNNMW